MYGNLAQLPLETINEEGKAPETRIADAASAREIFQKLIMEFCSKIIATLKQMKSQNKLGV